MMRRSRAKKSTGGLGEFLHGKYSNTVLAILAGLLVGALAIAGLMRLKDRAINDTGTNLIAADGTVTVPDVITVGPEGHFQSIADAIEFVKLHYKRASLGRDRQIIEVAGGHTFAERIVVDNSDLQSFDGGIEIVSRGASPAILAPAGTEPIVMLSRVQELILDGFQLQAADKPVAIEMTGVSPGSQLRNLRVSGFTESGVRAVSLGGMKVGGRYVVIQDIDFSSAATGAAGVMIQADPTTTSNIRVAGCRFLGPMSSGILINAEAVGIEIRECLFHQTESGLRIDGEDPMLLDLAITNNTFHQVATGIAIANRPAMSSSTLDISRNLFAAVANSPAMVLQNYDEEQLRRLGDSGNRYRFNLTDSRIRSTDIDLFARDGRSALPSIRFASSNPADADFLKPIDLPTPANGEKAIAPQKPWVGAVRP